MGGCGRVAANVEGAGGVAAESAEEEGVVEITDPGDDVGPVQRQRETLRAEEEPPTPRVQRKGNAGDERGARDGGEGEFAAEAGELVPVDAPHEGGDEESRAGVTAGAAGGGVEEGEEAAHEQRTGRED